MERNVLSLDTVGLGLVERGVAKLDAKPSARTAEGGLPHRGRPRARAAGRARGARRGPAEEGAARSRPEHRRRGLRPRPPSCRPGAGDSQRARPRDGGRPCSRPSRSRGRSRWRSLARRGGLLRHDLEEWLGPAQGRSASLASSCCSLLLPVATFQGWGWLPLWWLALLFAYLDVRERVLVGLLLAAAVAVGPAVASLELRLRTARNPLFHAALAAVESAPDRAAIARLEEAARSDPEDRDLAYLLGCRSPARRPLRGGGGAVPADARGRSQGRGRAEQPREHRVRARQLRRGAGAVPGGHGGRGAAGDRGHLVLQPVARPPPEVRVPGLQRGQVERGPARSRARGRLRRGGSTTRATTRWWTSA